MATRHEVRIAVMQAIFQLDVQGDSFAECIADFLQSGAFEDADLAFARRLIDEIRANGPAIDRWISEVSEHWDLGRMTPIDRSILRLAVCELLFEEQTPPKVAIDEAVELAKAFGAAESPQFVNGLLDAIWKKHNNPS